MSQHIFRMFDWSDGHESDTVGFFTGESQEMDQLLKSRYGSWPYGVGVQEVTPAMVDRKIDEMQQTIDHLTNMIEEAQIAKANFEDS